jgi:AcrR family transcriptional regulator
MANRNAAKRKRIYLQVARASAVAETEQRILFAATQLFAETAIDEVRLEDVARLAGVSAKTVKRRFGSRDELARTFIENAAKQNAEMRNRVQPGDVRAGLSMILEMYELVGDAVMRILALEGRMEVVDEMAARGRVLHEAWLERVFGPCCATAPAQRAHQLSLLLIATDVFTWKLLRRDRRLSLEQTRAVVDDLVAAALPRRP